MQDAPASDTNRLKEWFVPSFGPPRFRAFIGMLFLPYTGMCVSFAIAGSILATSVHWDRVLAIAVIYFLGLGVSAHAADALGSRSTKPWGNYFSRLELLALLTVPVVVAYVIGAYYILSFAPMLGLFAALEGFFLFAYNLELFGGAFHNNFTFAISWGSLPILAGYSIQASHEWTLPIVMAGIAGIISFYHIRVSREYKVLKRSGSRSPESRKAKHLEYRLKIVSCTVIALTIAFVALRGGA